MNSDDLSSVLTNLGIDVRRNDGKEILGRCPVHFRTTGHEDRHPSWSMNASTGLWLCFSCGARGTLGSLVSELSGNDSDFLNVQKLLINAGIERAMTDGLTVKPAGPPIDWLTYSRFTKVPSRLLKERKIDEEVAWKYGIRWESSSKCWIIPIVSPMGDLKGWQLKKSGWVRNYPEGVKKSETMFGIEQFRSKTAILVESPLDVVRIASVFDKPQGLATFGTSVSTEQLQLLADIADRVIVAMDNDTAGFVASKRLSKIMPLFRKGVRWFNYANSSAKDIGEMSSSQIEYGIAKSSVFPPWV